MNDPGCIRYGNLVLTVAPKVSVLDHFRARDLCQQDIVSDNLTNP